MIRAACIAAAVLLAGSGCASMRADRARSERLRGELDALRYTRPLDDVWLEVRRLLAERDYPLAAADAKVVGQPAPGLGKRLFSVARETRALEEDPGLLQRLGILGGGPARGLTLETGWRRTMDRYRVEAVVEDGGGVRVLFTRLVDDGTDRSGKPSRDLDIELALARRVDPDAAARIDAALEGPAR